MSTAMQLRLTIHTLAAAYDDACAEYGETSQRAMIIAEMVEWMRHAMTRYSATAPARALEAVRD